MSFSILSRYIYLWRYVSRAYIVQWQNNSSFIDWNCSKCSARHTLIRLGLCGVYHSIIIPRTVCPAWGVQWGEGLPDFLFGFLRTVAKFCAIICCKPLAQLKPIHALGHWVAQNIAENKKYLGNVSYIDKGTHTDATQQRRRRRHSGEQPDKWQNGRWSPKSARVKMRREQSVKSCLENA